MQSLDRRLGSAAAQEEKSPVKVKGITEKIAEAAKAEDAKATEVSCHIAA